MTMVTLMVMNGEGGFGTCMADITVIDGELPVLNNCPEETIILELDAEGQQPNAFIFPTAIDNCDGVLPVVCSHEPDDDFPSGSTVVECTAIDDSDKIGLCEFIVSVLRANGGLCTVAGPINAGTTAANAIVPLIPLLAVGLRAMLRRRRKKG
ncbi:MAG: HYR domain-containing protein, partial [Thermodesulfobacteriota bacterium]